MSDQAFLTGRTALVTGAASGIGLAVAACIGRLGAEVVMADVQEKQLQSAVQDVPRSRAVVADLSSEEDIDRLAREAGAVDILVNNAGLQHVAAIEDFPEDRWRHMIAVMLTAPFLLTKRLLPGMYERDWGRIVNISSVHGLVASPYKAAYISAKHGLNGLTKTVALEAGARSRNITANAICPSYVRTPLVEKQISDQARVHSLSEQDVVEKVLLERNAIKRLVEPDEVASMVAFLCRDDMWSVTGRTLPMDAGWLAH